MSEPQPAAEAQPDTASAAEVHAPATSAGAGFSPAKAWRDWSSALLGLLFPPECTYCRALLGDPSREVALCDDCRSRLTVTDPQCPFCAGPAPLGAENLPKCVRCRGIRWHFDQVYAIGTYKDDLRAAVLRSKTPADEPLTRALGMVLAERVAEAVSCAPLAFDVVVPVPLHWMRRYEHGTNNAETLGEMLAARLGLPHCADGLARIRETAPQTSVTPAERFPNVRGAFAASDAYDWAGARVLLVDDILTTGATANECARMLKASQVAAIHVAVLARGVGETRQGPRPKLG